MLGPHVGASSKLCNPMHASGPGPRPDGIEVADIGSDLPQEPNSFVGRERELGELRKLLCATRMLTLTGPGGIGKTRLALRVLAAAAGEFADGACYVELADLEPGSPDLVAARVAAALGVAEEQGRPLLDTIADTLRPRELLLGLDNCEHLLDECARSCGCWPPAASRCASPARRSGRCRRWRSRRRLPQATRPRARPSGFSPNGRRRLSPGSRSPRRTRTPWRASAVRSTESRWRSNWPPPASARFPWSRSGGGWPTGSGC